MIAESHHTKNFDTWNTEKKSVHGRNVIVHCHPREVWWCYLGVNVGTEQDGDVKKFLRPVVIIRAFGVHACLVVPLTTSRRTHAMRIDVGTVDGNQAKANISQMKVIDTKRLLEKMGMLEVSTFEALRKAVKDML